MTAKPLNGINHLVNKIRYILEDPRQAETFFQLDSDSARLSFIANHFVVSDYERRVLELHLRNNPAACERFFGSLHDLYHPLYT